MEKTKAMPTVGSMLQPYADAVGGNDAPKFAAPPVNLHLDSRVMDFRMSYRPAPNSGLSLLSSPVHDVATKSCVFMRVTVDGSGREGVPSSTCGVTNLALITFPAIHARDLGQAMVGTIADQSGQSKDNPLSKLISVYVKQQVDAYDPTIALMQEVIGSKEILVDLPLTDGDSTVVTIHPQDPDFQQFAAKCLAAFPPPPKAPNGSPSPSPAPSSPANTSTNQPMSNTFTRRFPARPGNNTDTLPKIPDALPGGELILPAQTKAIKEHKSVLILFGASWCVPCRAFDRFEADPQIRTILDRYFVTTHITVDEEQSGGDRNLNSPNGSRLETALLHGRHRSIPFTAILNPETRGIADSIMPVPNDPRGGNIGYPATPTEIAWFLGVIRQSTPWIAPADAATIERWLKLHGHA